MTITKAEAMKVNVTRYKRLRTLLAYVSFVSFGMASSLAGPAFPDLMDHLGVTAQQMGFAGSIFSIVGVIFSQVSGPLIARFQSHIDLFISIGFFMMVIGLLIIPTTHSYSLYVIGGFTLECGMIFTGQSSNLLVMSLWGKEAAPLQALHCCWALGFSIGPYIIRPYLGPERGLAKASLTNITHSHQDTFRLNIGKSVIPNVFETEDSIQVAYQIVALFLLLCAVCNYLSYRRGLPQGVVLHIPQQEACGRCCPNRSSPDFRFTLFISISFSVYYFLNACEENFTNAWLVYFAVKSDHKFTKKDAALLDAAAKFSILVGRILGSLIALRVSVKVLMFVSVYGEFIALVLLAYLGTLYRPCLWLFVCLKMLLVGPKWPSGLAWTNLYIPISGANFILMNLGSGLGWMFISSLTGWLFTHTAPNNVIMVPVYVGGILCLHVLIMQIVANRHGERKFETEEKHCQELTRLVDQSDSDVDVYSAGVKIA